MIQFILRFLGAFIYLTFPLLLCLITGFIMLVKENMKK